MTLSKVVTPSWHERQASEVEPMSVLAIVVPPIVVPYAVKEVGAEAPLFHMGLRPFAVFE